jgi:hypothetical protein
VADPALAAALRAAVNRFNRDKLAQGLAAAAALALLPDLAALLQH